MNGWREKYTQAGLGMVARGWNIQFELLLLVRYWYGPYFTVRASLIQARDAWNDDGTRPEKTPAEKNHEMNDIVLTDRRAVRRELPRVDRRDVLLHPIPAEEHARHAQIPLLGVSLRPREHPVRRVQLVEQLRTRFSSTCNRRSRRERRCARSA